MDWEEKGWNGLSRRRVEGKEVEVGKKKGFDRWEVEPVRVDCQWRSWERCESDEGTLRAMEEDQPSMPFEEAVQLET